MQARPVVFLILAVLIQMGMLHRVMASGACCPEIVGMHCHDHAHTHPHHDHDHHHHDHHDHDEQHDADPGILDDSLDADGKPVCPQDDCGHHHHHGSCVHSIPLSVFGVGDCRLPPLSGLTLAREKQNLRVPVGPVMEKEIPPLI